MAERTAVIVGGNRIPFVKAGGAYAQASNVAMLTAAIDGLVARFGLAGATIDEVVVGCRPEALARLQPHPRGRARLRAVAPHPRLRPAAGLRDGSGSGRVRRQQDPSRAGLRTAIAGGVDSASDAPIVVSEGCVGPCCGRTGRDPCLSASARWRASVPPT